MHVFMMSPGFISYGTEPMMETTDPTQQTLIAADTLLWLAQKSIHLLLTFSQMGKVAFSALVHTYYPATRMPITNNLPAES